MLECWSVGVSASRLSPTCLPTILRDQASVISDRYTNASSVCTYVREITDPCLMGSGDLKALKRVRVRTKCVPRIGCTRGTTTATTDQPIGATHDFKEPITAYRYAGVGQNRGKYYTQFTRSNFRLQRSFFLALRRNLW